jgi:hypothetical protein
LSMVKLIALAIARLHNFAINERLYQNDWDPVRRCAGLNVDAVQQNFLNEVNDGYEQQQDVSRQSAGIVGGSFMRLMMARQVENCSLSRPTSSILHPNHRVAGV